MAGEERKVRLAYMEAMMEAAGLTLHQRYVELAAEGLRLTDINHRNCVSHPVLDTVILVERPDDVQPSTEPQ